MSTRKQISTAAIALGIAIAANHGVAYADDSGPAPSPAGPERPAASTGADSVGETGRALPHATGRGVEPGAPAVADGPRSKRGQRPGPAAAAGGGRAKPSTPARDPITPAPPSGAFARTLPVAAPVVAAPVISLAAGTVTATVPAASVLPSPLVASAVQAPAATAESVLTSLLNQPGAPAQSPVSWMVLAAARREDQTVGSGAVAATVTTGVEPAGAAPTPGTASAVAPTAADRAFWTSERGIGFSVGSQGALVDQARLDRALKQVNTLGFNTIRTWGTDAYTGRILEAITRLNLPITVQAGIYITTATDANAQIDSALAIIKPYSDRVIGVSLGNEQLVDWNTTATLSVQNVIDQVTYFKSKSTIPVTYNFAGETFLPGASQWNQNLAGLLSKLDYINVHSYAGFFDNRNNPAWTPAKQMDALKSYEAMLSTKLNSLGLGSKPVILGETGWQSTGYNAAVTNPTNMQQYYEAVTRYVYGPTTRFDGMFYFNFTDEAWKGGDNFWGLYSEGTNSAIGSSKFSVASVPQIVGTATATPTLQTVKTNGTVALLKDATTGIAYLQQAGATPIPITRADTYWTGQVPLTRNGATLISAAIDAAGQLRVLDTSSYGQYGWALDTNGKFTGEQKYDTTTTPAAETLFNTDLNNDGKIGTLTSGTTTGATTTSGGTTTGGTSTAATGSFPVTLVNRTGGAWRDDQIFVTVIGQTTPGVWSWVDATGTAHPLDHNAASATDRLTKNGVGYANMAFTVAQAANLRIPPELQGARLFVSMGQPLYIAISPDDKGWAGPNPTYPGDPNYNTVFDWYELTYDYGKIPFGGNTTQVDQFGLPMSATLEQSTSGYSTTRGVTVSRAQLLAAFAQNVPAAFQPLVVRDAAGNPLRIVAPRTSATGALATWLDPSVNDFWTKYKSQSFSFTGGGYSVTGRVDANDQFAYTVTSGGVSSSYTMRKPTSAEIFACAGPFSGPGLQGAFLAELSAAFNRGVADSPQSWATPAAYYPAGKRWNDFAKLFHDFGVDRYAYGFPYDDVTSQSSVQILGNAQPPGRLTITIGW